MVVAGISKQGEIRMSSSDHDTQSEHIPAGPSAREFLNYSKDERQRRENSGEAFDEQTYDEAVQLVLSKLRVLADEGWT
jgi:hypothetical protein